MAKHSRTPKPLPSQARLREMLDYDPATGLFTWLHRPELRPQWNGNFPGKVAGRVNTPGYVVIAIDNASYHGHRLAWKLMTGEEPPMVDHKNGNPSDNRFSNLRASSSAQNQKNMKLFANNTSGVSGVWWCARFKRWKAGIGGPKVTCLGSYLTKDEAIAARKDAELRLGFSATHGRR